MNIRPALLLVLSLGMLGCPKKPDTRPAVDSDANSGPDGKRTGAVKLEVNKLSAPDEVNFDKADMTDWKMIELKGKPSLLTAILHWDNANSDMNIDIFDGIGTNIASSPGPQPGAQEKHVVAQIDTLGIYYLRVQAPKAHDGSVYTVEAKWEGGGDEAPKPVVEAPVQERVEKPKKAPKEHHEHVAHTAKFDPENGVQGRIVSSYREGASMVLHIDKGSAAGVKVGQAGAILDGPSGANALDGGSFSITSVVDDGKCIGKTSLHSIGKNNRVSINVK